MEEQTAGGSSWNIQECTDDVKDGVTVLVQKQAFFIFLRLLPSFINALLGPPMFMFSLRCFYFSLGPY